MKIIEIKEYTPAYKEAAYRLLGQLVSGAYTLTESYLNEVIASDNSYLFFLLEGEQVLGMYTLGIYKTPTGIKGWLEDVVIDDAYRGKGLGRILVEHAIDQAKTRHVDTFMLTSNPTRVAANNLYSSLGFEQRETNVYRMLFNK